MLASLLKLKDSTLAAATYYDVSFILRLQVEDSPLSEPQLSEHLNYLNAKSDCSIRVFCH